MTHHSSSSLALFRQPSSRAPLCAAVHEPIVRPIGGMRKGTILPYTRVQFSVEVRGLMSDLGVTIREAAEWSGFSEKTIGKWRRGASAPDINEGRAFLLRLIERAQSRADKTGT